LINLRLSLAFSFSHYDREFPRLKVDRRRSKNRHGQDFFNLPAGNWIRLEGPDAFPFPDGLEEIHDS
jgi:hypothetical protein